MRSTKPCGLVLWLRRVCLVLLVVTSPSIADDRIALVIGNSDYEEIASLPNPRNDAQDVAERLQALGFHLYGDRVHYNLNERQLLARIEDFSQAAEGREIAFLYFAGHGMQFDGDPHLLPVDIPDASLSIVRREAVGLNGLLDSLAGRAKLTVAVFDACREIPNYRRQIKRATRGGSDSAWRGLSRPSVLTESTLIAYSGGSGELVADGVGRNSPYTTLLLRNLDQEIDSPGRNDAPDFFSEVAYQFRKRHKGQSPEVIIQGVRPNRFFLSDLNRSESLVASGKGQLTVKVEPGDARIRIMNIEAKYRDGIELDLGGKYDILVSREGYKSWRNAVELNHKTLVVPVVLEKEEQFVNRIEPEVVEARVGESASANASLVELEWWNLAKEVGTSDAFRDYLERYPTGEFAEVASTRLSRLEADSQFPGKTNAETEKRGVKNRQKAEPNWLHVKGAGTIEAIENYIDKCDNNCRYWAEAESRLSSIRREQAAFNRHLQRNELTSGKQGTAVTVIKSVEALVPADPWSSEARLQVAERYLQLARKQEQAGKLDSAQRLVAKGLSVVSTRSLESLRKDIEQQLSSRKSQQTSQTKARNSDVVIMSEASVEAESGPQIELPSNPARLSGVAVSIKAFVTTDDKVDTAYVYWSTSPDFAGRRTARMLLKSKVAGRLEFSGRFTPSVNSRVLYYYIVVTDSKGLQGTKGTVSSPLRFDLPARKTSTKTQPVTASASTGIVYGDDCEKGNVFTKTHTHTRITDRTKVPNTRGKRVPYGSVSTIDATEGKEYYIYTVWDNLRRKKYKYHYSLYDSNERRIIYKRSYDFDVEDSDWSYTTWHTWTPSSTAPTGKYTFVICEGGKRHVKTFQVVR